VILRPPTEDALIRFFLIFDNAFAHNTIVMRREVMEAHGLRYDPDYKYSEDYEFWVRCSGYTKIANIPEVLVQYRYHPENTSNRFRKEQNAAASRIRHRQLQALELTADAAEISLHNAIATFQFQGDYSQLVTARGWLEKLIWLGAKKCKVPEREVYRHLSRFWYGACGKSADLGWPIWRLFRSSPIGKAGDWEWQWKLLVRCLLRKKIDESLPDTFS
jgi:hypothetical protein